MLKNLETENILNHEIIKILKTIQNKTNTVKINKGNNVFFLFNNYFIFVKLNEEIKNNILISDIKSLLKFFHKNKKKDIYYKTNEETSIFYTNENIIEIEKNKEDFNLIDIRDDIKKLETENLLIAINISYERLYEAYIDFKKSNCNKNIRIKAFKDQKFFIIQSYNRCLVYEKIIKVNKPIKYSFDYNFYLGKFTFFIEKKPVKIKLIKSNLTNKVAYIKLIQDDNIQLISSEY